MASKKNANPENVNPEENIDTAEAVDTAADVEIVEEAAAEPTSDELIAAERDKYLRLAAEYDNYRKRSAKEREMISTDTRADTVARLLPVYDNLLRALATPCADEEFFKGIEMTLTQFRELLAGLGVEEIPAVGEKFNPDLHNAVSQVDNPDFDSGAIVLEFQRGFILNGRVIRHSVVQVNN